jgi:serine/threonine protein kinase
MPTQGLAAGGNGYDSKVPQGSPNFREEAERIVADERAQSEKMPVYEVCLDSLLKMSLQLIVKGLEQYRLVEKMGDGAFSNVYKAVDRKTGQKVAVKVVRKYELNSTQVRITFYKYPLHSFLLHPSSPMPWPGMGSR